MTTVTVSPKYQIVVLKEAREALGLSQSALAKQAGVAQSTISALETGVYAGSMESLPKVGAVLGLTLDEMWRMVQARRAERAAETEVTSEGGGVALP